jgi:glycopeptide antibiotics resistance protein
MHPRTMSRFLWLISTLFIIYGTSIPFRFVPDSDYALHNLSRASLDMLASLEGRRPSFSDVLQNVLLFVPFGLFGCLSFDPRRRLGIPRVLVACLGLALSVFVESLQLFTTERLSSMTDVAANTAGATVGVIAAPVAALVTRQIGVRLRAYELGATAFSFYPVLVTSILLLVAAWQPFDFSIDPGGAWSKVKTLRADPLQVGAIGDEVADALRYALFGAAAVTWLRSAGVRHAVLLTGIAGVLVACALEGSQLLLQSRMPGGKDVLVATGGVWIGILVAGSPMRRWPPMRLASVVVLATWAGAALVMLTPFDWTGRHRPFEWMPVYAYYRSGDQPISVVIELALVFVPAGFALARAVKRSWLWATVAAVVAVLAWPLEYLQGWTATRVPDVTGVGIAVLGGLAGAWAGGPLWGRFTQAITEPPRVASVRAGEEALSGRDG